MNSFKQKVIEAKFIVKNGHAIYKKNYNVITLY